MKLLVLPNDLVVRKYTVFLIPIIFIKSKCVVLNKVKNSSYLPSKFYVKILKVIKAILELRSITIISSILTTQILFMICRVAVPLVCHYGIRKCYTLKRFFGKRISKGFSITKTLQKNISRNY